LFEEKDIFLESGDKLAIGELIDDLRSSSRLWVNNGHTSGELAAM